MTAAAVDDPVHPREAKVAAFRDAAKHLGVNRMRDGTWFRRVVATHVKKHLAEIDVAHWDRVYPNLDVEERAQRQIRSVARRASAAGAFASLGASAGELLALLTEGVGAPIGVPAAMLSMALEAAYTSLLQVDLACDLASIYGVPFDADDVGEVATLFGLSLDLDVKEKHGGEASLRQAAAKEVQGLTARLIALEDGEIATRIGRKLLEDAVVRNAIPIAGVAISARWNYVATKRLGATVRKYVRYRRALVHACTKLRLDAVTDPSLLVGGAWLLATVDGDAGHEEVMALALIVDQLADDQREALAFDKTLGDDEEKWFEELAHAPAPMHGPLLDVLYLVAATDKEIEASERRFLRRVGKALGRDVDLDRIARICEHLDDGSDLPDDFFECTRSNGAERRPPL